MTSNKYTQSHMHYTGLFDIFVASLQKGPHVAKIKNEIFDLNRAGHDKFVEKKISVLAQIFTKLRSIYEHLHNFNNYT